MKKIIFILLFTFPLFLEAQEEVKTYNLNLQEAIDLGLKNNYSLLNATKDVEAAKHKKWETITIGLPQINVGIDYLNNIKIQKSVVPAEFFGGNPGEFAEVEFGTKQNMNARATLSQLIFDGSYLVGLESARVYLKISENAKIKTQNEVKNIIIQAYTNVLLARESVLILEKNKQNINKNLFEANETYKNGLIEEENVEQLQITSLQINNSLQNAQRRAEIALNMLKLVLGVSIKDTVLLKDELEQLVKSYSEENFVTNNFEVSNNIDFLIGLNNKESKRLLVKYEKSKYLPSLAANLNFGYNAFSNEFSFLNNNQKWFNYSNLGVGLNIPVFSSFGRNAKVQQAKIAEDQAAIQLKETQEKLVLEWQQAYSDYTFSLEQLSSAKQNLRLAERIEYKQQIKFKEGLSSSFEFTEAQRQLYASQQNYLQAMVDVLHKKSALEKLNNYKN